MPQVSISIPQGLIDLMKQKVEGGFYTSNSEVIREGLRLLFETKHSTSETARFNTYLETLAKTNKSDFSDTSISDIIKRNHTKHGIE